MYNLVGFQTRLKFGEQKRVFGMIPGLQNAEYLRYGVMHRNTYINSPKLLNKDYSMRDYPDVYFAGQITGVEGYIESAASGFLAGLNAALRIKEDTEALSLLNDETVIGAMAYYVSDRTVTKFVPMNANFGIVAPMPGRFKGKTAKQDKNSAIANRSLARIEEFSDIIKKIKI
jgi:methylenetetrahydrofolate--tRNA-(uracil-5-)-methyltransferase